MPSTSKAGGCFLATAILAGFAIGLWVGDPMRGVLTGTALGIMAALVLWLVDRRRPG